MDSHDNPDDQTSSEAPSLVKIRWWVFCFVVAIVASPVFSVLLGLNLHAREFQDQQDGAQSLFAGRTVELEVTLIAADPKQGRMTLDWRIMGELQSACSPANLTACTSVNIYFDNNLLSTASASGSVASSDRPSIPIFRLNATALVMNDILSNSPVFRTDVALFSPGSTASSLLFYPFDGYLAELLLFAQDATTGDTVGVVFGKTRGVAVGFSTKVISRSDVYIPPGAIDSFVILSRDRFVKLYAVAATMTIWLITLILLLVMLMSVFFGFRQKGEILLVPIATLFALTQLRTSMPGAPDGFGDILDFVGLLPCLAILSLSASLILGAFIFTDPTKGNHSGVSLQQIYAALMPRKTVMRHIEDPGALEPTYNTSVRT